MTSVATIVAEVDKKRVLCRVSIDVLQKKCGASAEDPMRAVAENRETLRTAAKKLIEGGALEEDGSIIIRSKDI